MNNLIKIQTKNQRNKLKWKIEKCRNAEAIRNQNEIETTHNETKTKKETEHKQSAQSCAA